MLATLGAVMLLDETLELRYVVVTKAFEGQSRETYPIDHTGMDQFVGYHYHTW